jgi:hypothetical protein
MARQRIEELVSAITASGVAAVVLDSAGNYSSGGIKMYAAVMLDTSAADVVKLPTGSNVQIYGFSQSAPVGPNQTIAIARRGRTKAIAASAISIGDYVMNSGTTGQVATATAVQTDFILGKAMTATANANELLEVELSIVEGKTTAP